MLKYICILSTLLFTSCFSLQEDENHLKCFRYKNITLKGIVNTEDIRITPQKPPGLDNGVSIIF